MTKADKLVWITEDTHAKLKVEAAKANRTMGAHISHLMEEGAK